MDKRKSLLSDAIAQAKDAFPELFNYFRRRSDTRRLLRYGCQANGWIMWKPIDGCAAIPFNTPTEFKRREDVTDGA